MMDETAVQQQQEETGVDETTLTSTDEGTGTTEGTEAGGLFPNTPAPDRPIPAPQAHRVRITGVSESAWPSGDAFLKVALKSLENASDLDLTINVPKAFSTNVMVDPATLSTEETLSQNGKAVPSERAQFARSVRNSGKDTKKGGFYPNTSLHVEEGGHVPGDGTIETIARFATEQGRSVNSPMPRTFTQLASYLNQLCTGTEAIALLRAQGGDGEFADRLRVQRLVSIEYASQETALKDYRKVFLGA